ncbi:hypothetical protein [Jannaschia sp. 2305UL9-9]|uniref:hypothetical protein n=1 Tax=Jannaschia sp. 2305UL9-9 TaxID=3121638 RepID=UPI003528C4B0
MIERAGLLIPATNRSNVVDSLPSKRHLFGVSIETIDTVHLSKATDFNRSRSNY